MPVTNPTRDELNALLLTMIVGVAGGTKKHWSAVVGPVLWLPNIDNVHSNWEVLPDGTEHERSVFARAVEVLREAYPYVSR